MAYCQPVTQGSQAPVSMGIAKPMPELAPLPVGSAMAVLIPISRPRLSSSGPPAGVQGNRGQEAGFASSGLDLLLGQA